MPTPVNILVLEDSPADAELMAHELRRADFNVTWRRAETQAEYLAGLDASPDVILADYALPQFDALKALAVLKFRRQDIPLIVVTGTLGDEIAADLIKQGAADYLLKDRMARLPQAVASALERTRLRREQESAASALREREAQYRAVVENAHCGFVIVQDDRIVYCNPAYADIQGWQSPDEALGHPRSWAVVPEDQGLIRQRELDRRRGAPVQEVVEYRIRRPDGEVRVLQGSGVDVTFRGRPARLSEVRDITQQRKLEDELRESEEQYRAVADNANDGISVLVDGKHVYVNKAFLAIHGMSNAGQVLGADPTDSALPEYRETMRQRIAARLRGEPVAGMYERKIKRPDGEIRTVQVSGASITFEGKQGVMGIIRDITEAKRLQEDLQDSYQVLQKTLQELREAQAHLVHQERLSALGQMASGIVHDFNNALTPIVGFLGMILDNPALLDDRPKALEYLRQCQSSAGDAGAIISRLRDFYRTREQAEPLAPTDVNQVVEHAMSVTEYAWRHQAVRQGIPIRVTPDLRPVPAILGQGQELSQVLTNLILNAVDAMPQGGAITLRTRQEQQRVLLEVSDTGMGMPEETRRRCFEPFFTTKGDKGTGLGLAVAYGVIQRHNGSIDVTSAPGKGTTFRIQLPVA